MGIRLRALLVLFVVMVSCAKSSREESTDGVLNDTPTDSGTNPGNDGVPDGLPPNSETHPGNDEETPLDRELANAVLNTGSPCAQDVSGRNVRASVSSSARTARDISSGRIVAASPSKRGSSRQDITFPSESDFNLEHTIVSSFDPSAAAFSDINNLLCLMGQTRYLEVAQTGQTSYRAWVDLAQCNDDTHAVRDIAVSEMRAWVVNIDGDYCSLPSTPITVSFWGQKYVTVEHHQKRLADVRVSLVLRDLASDVSELGAADVHASYTLTSPSSSDNEITTFDTDLSITPKDTGDTQIDYTYSDSLGGMVAAKIIQGNTDDASGIGRVSYVLPSSASATPVLAAFSYDAEHLALRNDDPSEVLRAVVSDVCGEKCVYSRDTHREIVLRGALYDSQGKREARQTSLSVVYNYDLQTPRDAWQTGWLDTSGYHVKGDTAVIANSIQEEIYDGSPGRRFEGALHAPGVLTQTTVTVSSLADILGWDLSFDNGDDKHWVRWNAEQQKFVILGVWSEEDGQWQAAAGELEFNDVAGDVIHSGVFQDIQTGSILTFSTPCSSGDCSPRNTDEVRIEEASTYFPSYSAQFTDLFCMTRCPCAACPSGYHEDLPRMAVAPIIAAESGVLRHYYFNLQDMTLYEYNSSNKIATTGPDDETITSGVLLSYGHLSGFACKDNNNAICPESARNAPIQFTWRAGSTVEDQYFFPVNDDGIYSPPVDKPLWFYKVVEDTPLFLSYESFGGLRGVPTTCVHTFTFVSVDCNDPMARQIPAVHIADRTVFSNHTGDYYFKALEVEQILAPQDTDAAEHLKPVPRNVGITSTDEAPVEEVPEVAIADAVAGGVLLEQLPPDLGPSVLTYTTGPYLTCFIRAQDRARFCVGHNTAGEWGDGITPDVDDRIITPRLIDVNGDWVFMRNSAQLGGLIKSNHALFLSGNGQQGQIGQAAFASSVSLVREATMAKWRTVSPGVYRACGIQTDNTLWCWGSGVLGLGVDRATSYVPSQVGTDNDWLEVVGGEIHTCAIKSNGALYCWGRRTYGNLGDGFTADTVEHTPLLIEPNGWSAIASSIYSTCGIKNGTLFCWGRNNWGQLATGDQTDRNTPTASISSANNWRSISSGGGYFCAINTDHELYCWGSNSFGMLGNGTLDDAFEPTPVNTPPGVQWKSIHLGVGLNACAQSTDDHLFCWGYNAYGELGVGYSGSNAGGWILTPSLLRVPDPSEDDANYDVGDSPPDLFADTWDLGPTVSTYASSAGISCFLRESDSARFCFGPYRWKEFGDNNADNSVEYYDMPHLVDEGSWTQIETIADQGAGIKEDGSLWLWGAGGYGQLGNGATSDAVAPVQESTDSQWLSISLGFARAVAIRSDHTLWSWGTNYHGALGLSVGSQSTPMQVGTRDDWSQVSAATDHTCAITLSGDVYCWGSQKEGLLGDGVTTDTPVSAPKLIDTTGWTDIAASYYSTCGIKNGELYCWGLNTWGQLGTGDTVSRAEPTRVGEANGWVTVDHAGGFACAINNEHAMYCWGNNSYGMLANGTLTASYVPTPVGMASDGWVPLKHVEWKALNIHGAGMDACAQSTDNHLFCWGYHYQALAGNKGSLAYTPKLVRVPEE